MSESSSRVAQWPDRPEMREPIGRALSRIPSGLFVLTAQHEDRRLGMLCGLVQQMCFEPPMICVGVAKGRSIMPLISESRQFAICQLSTADRVTARKFSASMDPNDDPFLGFDLIPSTLPNLPILRTGVGYLECELARHLDVKGDHDLFVGLIRGGDLVDDGDPVIHLREDGYNYR